MAYGFTSAADRASMRAGVHPKAPPPASLAAVPLAAYRILTTCWPYSVATRSPLGIHARPRGADIIVKNAGRPSPVLVLTEEPHTEYTKPGAASPEYVEALPPAGTGAIVSDGEGVAVDCASTAAMYARSMSGQFRAMVQRCAKRSDTNSPHPPPLGTLCARGSASMHTLAEPAVLRRTVSEKRARSPVG